MTHPHQLAAIAALSSLRQAYPRLAELAEAEAYQRHDPRRRTGVQRDPSDRARAREAQLLRAERADRTDAVRRGVRPVGSAPAPIRAALLDAQVHADTTVEALCWDLSNLLRRRPLLVYGDTWTRVHSSRWTGRTAYLAMALRHVDPATAARAARQLDRADKVVRAACGISPDRRRLPGDPACPACGRQTLRVEASSLDERDWTVSCGPDCRCAGVQCSCKRPDRQPGDPHLWPVEEYAANFGELRGYLRAMRAVEAGAITRDGIVYATAEQLAQILGGGVTPTPTLLRDWHRRGLVTAVKVGRTNWYRLDEAYAANERTQGRTKARGGSAA